MRESYYVLAILDKTWIFICSWKTGVYLKEWGEGEKSWEWVVELGQGFLLLCGVSKAGFSRYETGRQYFQFVSSRAKMELLLL